MAAFLPISDVEDEGLVTPFVTVALIAINVLVFIFVQPSLGSPEGGVSASAASFYDQYAVQPVEIASGNNLVSMITAMFLHGGLVHLGSNMLYLWIFGDNVEHALGHLKFLGSYLASGIAATILQVALFAGSDTWNLGASGAIAGVLGAYLVMFPHSQVNVLAGRGYVTRLSAVIVIGLWFLLQLISGGSQLLAAGDGGVAYWAHIGGFVAGAGMALLVGGFNWGPRAARS